MELPLFIKSAVVIVLFWTIYMIFLRKETLFKHHRVYFLAGIIFSIIFPFIEITQTVWLEMPSSQVTEQLLSFPIDETTLLISEQTSWQETINWSSLIFYVYGIGIMVMSLRFISQLTPLVKLLATEKVHKREGLKFIETHKEIAPFSFFKYIVYNPTKYNQEELNMILQHEKNHAKQWHSIDVLLSNILLILQWFNPIAWLYQKRLVENLEFMADQTTVQEVPSATAYQLTLVKASSNLYAPELGNSFYQSFIKKRIIMLNKSNSKKRNSLKAILVVPILTLLLFSFNVKEEVKFKTTSNTSDFSKGVTEGSNSLPINSEIENSEPIALESTIESVIDSEDASLNEVSTKKLDDPTIKFKTRINLAELFEFTIHKNTTNAQLEEIKQTLKNEHGIDLSYTVVRNDSGEIISLGMQYTGNDKNGSYQVSDDEGIDEILFYMNDEGRMGFYSEAAEERRMERAEERLARMEERKLRRLAEMKERTEERVEEMELRKEERMMEMELRRKELEKRREKMGTSDEVIERIKIRTNDKNPLYVIDGDVVTIKEIDRLNPKGIATVNVIKGDRALKVYGHSGKDGVVEIYTKKGREINTAGYSDKNYVYSYRGSVTNDVLIDKNTTDSDLKVIKEELAAKNISFKYKGVKRNSQGEITSIKLNINNNKGSKISKHIRSNDGEPIETIHLEL